MILKFECINIIHVFIELATHQCMSMRLRDYWEVVLLSNLSPLSFSLNEIKFEFLKLAVYVGLIKEDSLPDIMDNNNIKMNNIGIFHLQLFNH